ncbi:MAG: CbtA family protein [Chloroflexi bacterium]|nr:CbtA family protein [Chloroflexota bacterium]
MTERLYPILRATLIAGLIAGLAMGLFHFVVTEPVIDAAIALEDEAVMSAEQAGRYAPVVSRLVQKVMLVAGSALYGLIAGIIFAVVFAVTRRRLPGRWPDIKAMALAGLLWWSIALLPFLKYPANPPGVGDTDTVYYRQTIQIAFIALSALAVIVAAVAYRVLGRWRNLGGRRLGLALAVYAVLAILLFVLMPPNPDAITAPAGLVWDFRILSLAGQVLFWALLGVLSALLLKRSQSRLTAG